MVRATFSVAVRRQPRQVREEGSDFELHLLACRGQSDRLGFGKFYLIAPRIDLDAAAQGQSGDLIQALLVKLRRSRQQSRHPQTLAARQGRCPRWGRIKLGRSGARSLQRLQEQSGIAQFVFVRRVLQQFQSLGVGGFFIRRMRWKSRRWNVSSSGKNSLSLKASLVSKWWPRHDVAEFMSQNHRQRGFIGKHIEQAAADDDGMADGEGFQGRRQQNAAMNVSLQIDVVGDEQVVDDGCQDLVDFAGGREQADFLEPLDGVLFGLLLPHALGYDRSGVSLGVTLIVHRLR